MRLRATALQRGSAHARAGRNVRRGNGRLGVSSVWAEMDVPLPGPERQRILRLCRHAHRIPSRRSRMDARPQSRLGKGSQEQ